MTQGPIENPVINSPFFEPVQHFVTTAVGPELIRDAAKEAVKFADLLVVCSFAGSVIKQGAVITS